MQRTGSLARDRTFAFVEDDFRKKRKKKEEEVVSRLKRNEKKRIRIEWNSDHRTSVVLKSLSNHSVRSIVVSKTYD